MSWIKQGRGFAFPEYKPQWPPDPPFDLLEVKADIKIDLKKRSISGHSVNTFKIKKSVGELVLDGVDMNILKVEAGGKKIDYTYDGSRIRIFFEEELNPGDIVSIKVQYSVKEPVKGVWFVPTDGTGPAKLAYTQGQPEDTRYWLPTYDYPNRKTKVELTIRSPRGLYAVANGLLVEKNEEGDWWVWKYRLDSRIPTYLIAFAVGDFAVKEEEYNGVLLQYVVPKGREEDIERSFAKTKEIMAFFEEYTGVKYPYPKYTQVCIDEFVAGGMENASVTLLTSRTLHDEKAHEEFRSEPLVAHEMAHQWFGDLVTCKDWSHLWLNESFATLMEALWRRRDLGEDEFVYDLILMLDSYLGEYKSRYSRPIVTRLYKHPDEVFDSHNYPKGALILWSLANYIGEENFRKAIKIYLENRFEDVADTDDLRKCMEKASGFSLDWFFEQYVFNSGHPILKVNYRWLPKDKIVEIKVSQTQKGDSLEEYTLPLEVLIIGDGYEERRRFLIKERQHVFPIPCPGKPKAVCIDPDFKSFKVLQLEVGVDDLLSMIKNSKKLYPRVVAARTLASKGSARVVEALKEILLDESEFWGLRFEVAKTIGSIGGETALQTLLEALEKVKHPRVRRSIVTALGGFKDKRAFEALVKVLHNDEEGYYVRASAAVSLAKTGFDEAFEHLKKALNYPSHSDVITASALEGMGILGTKEALEEVKKYLAVDKPLHLRAAATMALGYFPTERKIIELLETQAKSRHPRIRGAVVAAAKRSLSPRLIPLLEKLRSDPSGSVARRAREALEAIRKHMEKGEEYKKLREELEKLREEERRLAERVEKIEKKF